MNVVAIRKFCVYIDVEGCIIYNLYHRLLQYPGTLHMYILQIFIYFKSLMLFFLGAFLVPFFLMLILCAIPLLYMELAVGQYTQNGPVGAIAKLCPLFKGKSLLNSIFLMT